MNDSCSSTCSSCSGHDHAPQEDKLENTLAAIKHKVMVLSGKGGVGKSSVAVNLAIALAKADYKVGLLDIDFHGPSIPTMLGLQNHPRPPQEGNKLLPLEIGLLKVMSIAFLLETPDQAVIWRGPMKAGVLKQLLEDVAWGELDYLVMDFPPGTGDEALSACQLVHDADGGIIVTTPQEVSLSDCRRCISFCEQLNLPVLGVIENMSGIVCPECNHTFEIFKSGGGEKMAQEQNVRFLGKLPLDPRLTQCCDDGKPFITHFPDSEAATAFNDIITTMNKQINSEPVSPEKNSAYKIAIPWDNDQVSEHFGKCSEFIIIETDSARSSIVSKSQLTAPEHQPGLIPKWINEQNVSLVIAQGIGAKAQSALKQFNIEVVQISETGTPEELVMAYLKQQLENTPQSCNHDHGSCGNNHSGGCSH